MKNSAMEWTEEIASQITSLSLAMKELQKGRLNLDAVVVLLQAQTKLPKKTIFQVMQAMKDAPGVWLRPPQYGLAPPEGVGRGVTVVNNAKAVK